jgi:hypothetical protein
LIPQKKFGINKELKMSYENNEIKENVIEESVEMSAEMNAEPSSGTSKIKFFGNCSKSLKRYSIILFIINIFVAIGLTGALAISLFFKVGLEMLGFLAFPLVTVFIVLLIIARFISALVYGFAEIVEKYEKK